jgi:hypothetical protein
VSSDQTESAVAGNRLARSIPILLAVAVVFIASAQVVAGWRFTTDDAYISLRYAEHLAGGHGLVWNVGESIPVEGYSNFLFVLLGALALRWGLPAMTVLKTIGTVALGAACVALYGLGRRALGRVGALIGVLLLVSYPGVTYWAVSGMETTVFLALVLTAVWTFGRGWDAISNDREGVSRAGRWMTVTGGLVFLGALTRPEGPVVGIVLLVVLGIALWRGWLPRRRVLAAAAALGLAAAVPFAAYEAWRWIYFHRLLPNSVLCKIGLDRSAALVHDFVGVTWPLWIAAAAPPWRRPSPTDLAAWLLGAFFVVGLWRADPMIGQWNRHFLAAGALLLVPAVTGVLRWTESMWPGVPRWRAELSLALLVLVLAVAAAPGTVRRSAAAANDYHRREEARRHLALWLNTRLKPGESYVIGDAGLVPFLCGNRVIDAYCLNCGEMTRPPIDGSPQRFVTWMLNEKPAMIVVLSGSARVLKPHVYRGVFPRLVAHPEFSAGYLPRFVAGAPGDPFQYWVFERRDRRAPLDSREPGGAHFFL